MRKQRGAGFSDGPVFILSESLMTFKLRQYALMQGIKTVYCCGDTTLKNGAGKETIWNF